MALRPGAPSAHALTARRALHGIYAIVNQSPRADEIAAAALRGGVRIIQYRAKDGFDPHAAVELRRLTRNAGALLLINDDWQAALTCDADGVHLGLDDARSDELPSIRAALRGRLLGLSCGTVDEARAAAHARADYIGVGSVYATASKRDAGEPIGIAGLKRVAAATSLPVAAIGGVTPERIAEIRSTGVAMAAVISAIASARDPEQAANDLVARWGST